MKLLRRINAGRDHGHVVPDVAQALDEVREPNLHATDVRERTRLHEDGHPLLSLLDARCRCPNRHLASSDYMAASFDSTLGR